MGLSVLLLLHPSWVHTVLSTLLSNALNLCLSSDEGLSSTPITNKRFNHLQFCIYIYIYFYVSGQETDKRMVLYAYGCVGPTNFLLKNIAVKMPVAEIMYKHIRSRLLPTSLTGKQGILWGVGERYVEERNSSLLGIKPWLFRPEAIAIMPELKLA
jgi:hypothetical protein